MLLSFVALVLFVVVIVVVDTMFFYLLNSSPPPPSTCHSTHYAYLRLVFYNSAFSRTLCGGAWFSLQSSHSAFHYLESSTTRHGCCSPLTYMAFPLTNSFSQSTSCQNCPSGQFTYDENDETSCLTSKVLPNGNGLSTNAGHNLRHIVLEWVAGRTSVIIEVYGHISDWNVSHITNMKYLFYSTAFNSDISKWDTGAVIDMSYSKSFIE